VKESNIYVALCFVSAFGIFIGVYNDNMPIVLLSILGIVLMLILANKSRTKESETKKQTSTDMFDTLLIENNLNKSHFYLNYNSTQAINIDDDNKIIAILDKYGGEYRIEKFSFNQIIESEIIQDGSTLNKTSKGSVIGGALIGGALAGGTGAVVGGLSADSKSYDEFKRIDLQITFDDLNSPLSIIEFMKTEYPITKDNPNYTRIYDEVLHWHKMLSVLIKRQQEKISN
jgi:hypothetical protein